MSRTEADTTTSAAFAPYLPLLLRGWARDAPGEQRRELDGSLVSVDLSGFTALSERLAAKGRIGAEELILLISGVFEGLIGIALRHGGDVLKFRGDALLLFFPGAGHELRACFAATEMQWFLERAGPTQSSAGDVRLRMSTGVFSGACHFYLVGSSHRELVVTGPATTETVRLEAAAEAGEIVVSAPTVAALDPRWLGGRRGDYRLLALPEDADAPLPPGGVAAGPGDDLGSYVPAPVRAHLTSEAAEGEHRQATVAFLRFGGTDRLLALEGPDAVLAQLDLLGRVVGETADELGVTWLESDVDVDGGKVYLTAGAPSSAGEDEERMLRAVRRILDAEHGPELRAGVNRGPVFAGDIGAASRRTYAVMGDTVNLAARLVARAGPGELYATAEVLERSRTLFETSHQPYLMKGKERPVTAYSVGGIAGLREEELDAALPLVGREAELETLRASVDAARLRRLQIVELVGEPGIGKSRLVHELEAAAVGFQPLVVRCERYESAHPFFAFRGVLRTLAGVTHEQSPEEAGAQLAAWVEPTMPDLAPWLPLLAVPFDASVPATPEVDSLDPSFRRDRLHDVVDQFLSRVLVIPSLLVFEDAHWMDDASHFLLRHLLASPVPRPWLVCVTRRPEGEPIAPEGRGTRLDLAPLPAEEVARLALAAAEESSLAEADLATLAARSGGNPLFVRELVVAAREHGAVGELPETVETLITARIDRLHPSDRLLLRYASVMGPAFELETLEEIVEQEAAATADRERWARLSEFVAWDGVDALRFRHDLFRAVAYAGLSFRRRREIHRRLGESLERRAADPLGEGAGLLSLHFAEAGEHERAWRYAVAAGRRAQQMHANVVAAELYRRALDAAERLPELPAAEVARVWESLGDVAELYGRYEVSTEAYEQARALTADDPRAQARLLQKEGTVCDRQGEYDRALRRYDRALAVLAGAEDDSIRAELELGYASAKFRRGEFDEAREWAERAAQHAEAGGNRSALAHAYYLQSTATHAALGPAEGEDKLLRALAIYEEIGNHVGQGNVLNNLGIERYYEGRWDEALDLWARSREAKQRAGDVVNVAIQALNEGEILSDQGHLEQAEELFREALRVHRAAGFAVGVAFATSNLGRAAARAGRFDEARELLEEARRQFDELGAEAELAETQARLAECLVLAGEHAQALVEASAAAGRDEESGASRLLTPQLERLIGYAHAQRRAADEARPHFERSLEVARELGTDFEVALTLRAMADTGVAADAEAARAESEAILERLGVVSTPRVPLP